MTKPITPQEINRKTKGVLYDEAVSFINEAITNGIWHTMLCESEEIRENYFAILESPYLKYYKVMPLVVEAFKAEGWDCFFQGAYDARGPHNCFYINKKHFV